MWVIRNCQRDTLQEYLLPINLKTETRKEVSGEETVDSSKDSHYT